MCPMQVGSTQLGFSEAVIFSGSYYRHAVHGHIISAVTGCLLWQGLLCFPPYRCLFRCPVIGTFAFRQSSFQGRYVLKSFLRLGKNRSCHAATITSAEPARLWLLLSRLCEPIKSCHIRIIERSTDFFPELQTKTRSAYRCDDSLLL